MSGLADSAWNESRGRDAPLVSIIIATYNRSNTLRHAIQSVVDSTLTDWEVLVVGDACTDDTAACVASFDNPRISFVNRRERCGDQSGPNNDGVARARGRYVAYLNHDDLFLPEHLADCVGVLERETDAPDLVWAASLFVEPASATAPGSLPFEFWLHGVPPNGRYSRYEFSFASSWVFRRELTARVGPWIAGTRLRELPSQNWLFRASRSGATLRFLPSVGVMVVPSGVRKNCYAERTSAAHEVLARWRRELPEGLTEVIGSLSLERAAREARARRLQVRRLLATPILVVLGWFGVHPWAAIMIARGIGRGTQIRLHSDFVGA